MMLDHYLRILGNPTLEIGDTSICLTSREAAFLAYLRDHAPRRVRRGVLTAMFWPSAPYDRSLRSLSQLLYQVRKKAPDVPIESTDSDIGIQAIRWDVDCLRQNVQVGRWAEAIHLFRGVPFGSIGFTSAEVELWCTGVVAEVSDLLVAAVQLGLSESTSLEDIQSLAEAAQRMIDCGLAPPEMFRLCVLATLRCGESHKARAVYNSFVGEYGGTEVPIESFQDLASLVESVNVQTPTTRSVKFVGRREELAQLQSAWQQAVHGNGRTVLISGEPGIGKSRLADQILRRIVLAGGRVWTAQCHAATRRSSLSTALDLIQRLAVHHDSNIPADVRSTLAGILDPGEQSVSYTQLLTEQWQHRRLEALSYTLGYACSAGPLAVFFDDVQWADDLTAQVLTLWALHVPALPVMLILTARTEEADPLPDWITSELSSQLHIRLGQLSIEAASELVAAFLENEKCELSEDTRSRVLWQSAGRPLLLLEALTEAARAPNPTASSGHVYLPETAEQLLRRRFRGLSSDAMWLIGLVAAYGTAIEPRLLAELSGLRDDRTIAALNVLNSRGILEFGEGRLEFPHDLMRETAYRVMPPATRVLLHQRIAAEMSRRGGSNGLLADHYSQAGDSLLAGFHSVEAARQAQDSRLYSDCIYYYRLALRVGAEEHRATAARELARHLAQVGRLNEGEELLPFLRPQTESSEAALLVDLIELERELVSGSADAALARARGVVKQAAVLQTSDLAMVLGPLLDVAHDAGNLTFAAQLLDTYGQLAADIGEPAFSTQVSILRATWEGTTKGHAAGWSRLNETIFDINLLPSITQTLAWYATGTLKLLAGELPSAVSALEQAASQAAQAGALRRLAAAEMNLAVALTEQGEFSRAQSILERLLTSPHRAYKLRAITNLAILQYEQGDDSLVVNTAQAIVSANASYGSAKYAAIPPALVGLVALRRSDYAAARTQYEWLLRNTCDSDYLSGDPAYTVSFVARMLAHDNAVTRALSMLDATIADTSPRDRVSGLRLSLTRARILHSSGDERAYSMAKQVKREALEAGATCLAADASTMVAVLR